MRRPLGVSTSRAANVGNLCDRARSLGRPLCRARVDSLEDCLGSKAAVRHSYVMFEAGLSLAAKRKHEHGVYVRHVAVECYVTVAASSNDQLALPVTERSSDQRAVRKDLHRLK